MLKNLFGAAFMAALSLLTVLQVQASQMPLEVYFVYDNGCRTCEDAEEFSRFFTEEVEGVPDTAEYTLHAINLFQTGTKQTFLELCEAAGVDGSSLKFPVVFIGDKYLAGGDEIREHTRELFIEKSAEAQTVYAKQNLKTPLLIVIPVLAILTIVIIFFYKKKKHFW
jgi:hypothetical protein